MSRVAEGLPALASALDELGAACVFGLPGTQNVPVFEALRRARLRTVLCTHELAASFAAAGYGRARGEPGVLVTIPGPGFTYALSGLAEARLDSAPVLHVLGLVAPAPHGRFDHQAIDHRAIGGPLVKAWLTVGEPSDLDAVVREAWALTTSGEPGPVVLQLGPDGGRASARPAPVLPSGEAEVVEARRRLSDARRPVLYLGQGAAGASDALRSLAERLGAPVLTTPSGRGIVPEDHALVMGYDPDRGGTDVVNALLGDADLIFAVGCRMGFNGTGGFALRFPPERLLHVNTDPEALDGPRPASCALVGRAEDLVPRLAAGVPEPSPTRWMPDEVAQWKERLADARPSLPEPVIHGTDTGAAADFFGALQAGLPGDAILVTDSGLHQALVRRHTHIRIPRGLIAPTDFQSMGFGIPGGLGVALARPERRVVSLVGDGGFAMSAMELRVAAREGIPLVVVVFNDGYLNLIRLQQLRDHGVGHAVDVPPTDVRGLAEAVGVAYVRVTDDVQGAIGWAVGLERPVVVEALVGDSPEILKLRASGAVRALGRRALGPTALTWVKRALGRR